jgi:hypothetical protein
LEVILACETCEIGLSELHEVACAIYIGHKYNQEVVSSFLRDEYFGS